MQDLKVTLVQANQVWEDKTANFKNYLNLLSLVDQTDLIILPEMFNSGFTMNAPLLAESFLDSESIRWLKVLSKEKKAAIYTSLIIEENGLFFNRGVFVEQEKITVYDKRQTFNLAGEDKVFTAGKTSTIVHYKNWKINLQICYDLRFPELSLNFVENEVPCYDLSIYVANWPEKRISHWDALLTARAIENQAYVIGLNRIGADNNRLIYNGYSKIIDASGETQLKITTEIAQTFVLQAETLIQLRNNLPFIKDRKC